VVTNPVIGTEHRGIRPVVVLQIAVPNKDIGKMGCLEIGMEAM
jgi:mRNA-degrading endonuclease toxin of MazEF toxin-antitoxin module